MLTYDYNLSFEKMESKTEVVMVAVNEVNTRVLVYLDLNGTIILNRYQQKGKR